MPVVNYLTLDGEIVSETRGGVDSDYIPDPLGSTSKLVNTGQQVTDTFQWWPYGELLSHSGSNPTPFGYVGTLGYHADPVSGLLYVRARSQSSGFSSWIQLDPLWPAERPYLYALGNPVSAIDLAGLQTSGSGTVGLPTPCADCLNALCGDLPTPGCLQQAESLGGPCYEPCQIPITLPPSVGRGGSPGHPSGGHGVIGGGIPGLFPTGPSGTHIPTYPAVGYNFGGVWIIIAGNPGINIGPKGPFGFGYKPQSPIIVCGFPIKF